MNPKWKEYRMLNNEGLSVNPDRNEQIYTGDFQRIGSAALAQHLSEEPMYAQSDLPPSAPSESAQHNTPESLPDPQSETARKSAEQFIRRYGRLFSLFARDGSLNYEPNPNASTFSFHPKSFKIEAPTSWFVNPEYTEDELQFANYHELAHFTDMRKNPEAYLKNFEDIEKEAEDLAKDYCGSHPNIQLDQVKHFYYKELHSLYNILDDIYVNNLVIQRSRFFDSGSGKNAIETLYKDKLGFSEADLTSQPLHRQMIYSLIRDEMLGDKNGKSIVDERVSNVLSQRILKKDMRDIINSRLKPVRGTLVDPEDRYRIIRHLIQPKYLELLEVSLKEQEQKQSNADNHNQNQSQGQNGDSSDFDPFNDKNNPAQDRDLLDRGENSEQTIKDILKSFKEAKDIDKMSPEERNDYLNKKAQKEFDESHNITEKERKESDRIKNKISKSRKEMRKFWHGLIGKSIEYRRAIVHRQKKGRLNVSDFIREYPRIVESEQRGSMRDLEIYDRIGLKREVVDQPESIDITLLVDCSGSMGGGRKIEAAKEAAALLMWSIKDFNDELDMTRRETRSKLRANTELITFGSTFEEKKSFNRNKGKLDNDADIIKSISAINDEMGGTDDASPLAAISAKLTSEERSKIKSKKLKKIIMEITDGASNDVGATSEQVQELTKEGVLMIGFQIGEVSQDERNIFNSIWNAGDASNKKGIHIGKDVSDLPDKLISSLADSLNGIII